MVAEDKGKEGGSNQKIDNKIFELIDENLPRNSGALPHAGYWGHTAWFFCLLPLRAEALLRITI